MFVSSGKAVNDLGNYQQCIRQQRLRYAFITVQSKTRARNQVQMGLCVPKECGKESLALLNKIYRQGMILTGVIQDPTEPIFTFPQD